MKAMFLAIVLALGGSVACGGVESDGGLEESGAEIRSGGGFDQPFDEGGDAEELDQGGQVLPECYVNGSPGTCYPSVEQCQSCCKGTVCRPPQGESTGYAGGSGSTGTYSPNP